MEIAAWFICLLIQGYVLRDFVSGTTSGVGDTLNFLYPYFSYFAENLMQGRIPLWDPYTHGGHPFYPMLGHNRLLDPVTIATILIGQCFTQNLLVLFNWNLLAMSWVMQLGVYLLLRPLFKSMAFRLTLIPILLFGSLFFPSLWHVASLFYFVWTPYILLFLNRIVFGRDIRWRNWCFLAGFLGIQSQGYFIASVAVLLFFYGGALAIFYRAECRTLFQSPKLFPKLAVLVAIWTTMLLQTGILKLDQHKFIFPYRMTSEQFHSLEGLNEPPQVSMTYDYLSASGAFSNPWNFLWLIYPDRWGKPAEVYLTFGSLVWLISMLGIFFGAHPQKKLWLFLMGGFGLLMLGPAGGLHRILFYLFPPVRFVRHLMEISYFFLLPFLVFYALGTCWIEAQWKERKFVSLSGKKAGAMLATTLALLGICAFLVPSLPAFLFHMAWAVVLPVVVFLFCRGKNSRTALAVTVLAVCLSLLGGFWINLEVFRKLYSLRPPFDALGVRTIAGDFVAPQTRTLSPFGDWAIREEPLTVPALARRHASVFNHNSSNDLSVGLSHQVRSHYLMFRDFFGVLRSGASTEELLDRLAVGKPLFQGPKGSLVQFESYSPNEVSLKVWSPEVGQLHWFENYDDWWRVSLNENSVRLLRGTRIFKAVDIPAGTSRVRFEYRPIYFQWALILYFLGGVVCFGFALGILLRESLWKRLHSSLDPTKDWGLKPAEV